MTGTVLAYARSVKYLWHMKTGRVSTFQTAAQSVDYDLAGWLLTCRAAGVSHREIARSLREEGTILASHETIRAWCRELSLDMTLRDS